MTDIRLHQEGSSVYAERVDWTDPVFQQIAAQYSDMLGCEGQECPVPKRYWCFAGRDGISLLLAIGNAATWDGLDSWVPTGFVRAWDEL